MARTARSFRRSRVPRPSALFGGGGRQRGTVRIDVSVWRASRFLNFEFRISRRIEISSASQPCVCFHPIYSASVPADRLNRGEIEKGAGKPPSRRQSRWKENGINCLSSPRADLRLKVGGSEPLFSHGPFCLPSWVLLAGCVSLSTCPMKKGEYAGAALSSLNLWAVRRRSVVQLDHRLHTCRQTLPEVRCQR